MTHIAKLAKIGSWIWWIGSGWGMGMGIFLKILLLKVDLLILFDSFNIQ